MNNINHSNIPAAQAGHRSAAKSMLDPSLVKPAIVDSFKKLSPRTQWRNPVMFVVYIGSILTSALWLQSLAGQGEAPSGFILAVALWLWFTVLFANFAEALAEGRSRPRRPACARPRRTWWPRSCPAPSTTPARP